MTRAFSVLLVVLAGVATVLRSPELLLDSPRLWAEEGRVYLSDALNRDPAVALTNAHMGYYSLSANAAAALAAHTVDLENAPFVTAWIALLLQLAPVVVIATSAARPWGTPLRKAVAIALLLAVAQGEVWLNTVNSQFFLAIGAALILVETVEGGAAVCNCWGRRVLLALAGLSGVLPAFLSPLWLWAAWRSRAPEAWIRVVIVGVCAGLQLFVAVGSISEGAERTDNRLHGVSVGTAGAVIGARLVVEPLAGSDPAAAIGDWFIDLHDGGGWLYHGIGAAVIAAIVFGLTRAARGSSTSMLPVSAGLVVTGSLIASWGAPEELIRAGHNTRYVVFPVTCLALFVADRALGARGPWRWIGLTLTAAALARGGIAFESGIPRDDAWPSWRAEVARYHADPTYRPVIWPGDPWHVIVDATKNRNPGVRVLGSPMSPTGDATVRLTSTPARLGSPVVIEVVDAPPNATGWVALDDGVLDEATPIPDLAGCMTWLPNGIDGLRKVPFTCDEAGRWTYEIDLQIVAAISGKTYTIQARLVAPAPAVSNAIALTVGF